MRKTKEILRLAGAELSRWQIARSLSVYTSPGSLLLPRGTALTLLSSSTFLF